MNKIPKFFTREEWTATFDGSRWELYRDDGARMAVFTGDCGVADGERAAMLAAAPELHCSCHEALKDLKKVKQMLEVVVDSNDADEPYFLTRINERIEQITEALEKASRDTPV